jgi:UDP-2-acetamido-2-deoxy-ribo-hexuluronate aminotransferase
MEAMTKVCKSAAFILGPECGELEKQLAASVDTKHCISVGSGTVAIEIVLRALGIGHGDEVITVPFTWISTAECVSLVGAKPGAPLFWRGSRGAAKM